MSTKYVSKEEIEAHEAAMQRVVEDEERKQEDIGDKKKRAIKDADDKKKLAVRIAFMKMRKAIEAAQRANDKAIKDAKNEEEDAIKAAEILSDAKQQQAKRANKRKLAVMQRDFERLPLLRQVYHEAPDDVFELIVSKCSEYGLAWGYLNALRLANKRLKQVVESCTTVLTNRQYEDGPDSLPIPIIQRCGRIEKITCCSRNLRSLEGCPDGLKKLFIGNAPHLSNLSPLASCSMMKSLIIMNSSITDITVVSSMPLLEVFSCQKAAGRPSIKDLTPLSSCPRLKELQLDRNFELRDVSALSACTALEILCVLECPLITSLNPLSILSNLKELYCSHCPLITSLAPLSTLSNLERLYCSHCPLITSLTPLSTLSNLTVLRCHAIDPQTSLLSLKLALCTGLEKLMCSVNAVDLEELRRGRPTLKVSETVN